MKTHLCLLLSLLLVALTACEKDVLPPHKSILVVEGWIEDEGFPVVILTESLPVSQEYTSLDNISDYLVKWAKVTVSDGEQTEILIGKYEKGFFPPYVYTTSRIKGKAGRTYTLTVEYGDYYATAATTIPEPPAIDNLSIKKCADVDTLYQIDLTFKSKPSKYYQIFTRVGANNRQFIASYLGSYDGKVLTPQSTLPVYKGYSKTGRNSDYTPYFLYNDTLTIKLACLDEAGFKFWDSYSKNLSLQGNLFLASYINFPSNINGGIGYWCGMGTDTKNLIVSRWLNENK